MSAYVIVNATPKNPEKLKEYGGQAGRGSNSSAVKLCSMVVSQTC